MDDEVIVPLAFYEWSAGIEQDVRVHDLTPYEIANLIERLSNPDAVKLAEELEQLPIATSLDGKHDLRWLTQSLFDRLIAALSRQPYPAPEVERLKDLVRRFGKCFSCKDGIASAIINDEPRNYTCLVCGGDGLHPDARAALTGDTGGVDPNLIDLPSAREGQD